MGFIDVATKATEPTVVELAMVLEDGQKAAVQCRPLISIDYFSIKSDSFNTIPILTGQKNVEDLDVGERIGMYAWMREVVRKAVVAVRDIQNGQSVWVSVHMRGDDLEQPTMNGDGKLQINVRMLEALNEGSIADVANAIIKRTNIATTMEENKSPS